MFDADNKDVIIQSGFVLTVSSWENDADHPKTESLHFKSLNDAKMYIQVVSKYAEVYGNQDSKRGIHAPVYTQDEIDWLSTYFDEKVELNHIDDWVSDMSYDILGVSEDYICRVISHYSIHEIEETVTFKVVQHGSRY